MGTGKNGMYLAYYSSVIVDNKMYFSSVVCNGLFEMNMQDFTIRFLGHFPDSSIYKMCLHSSRAIEYENTIFFFPLNGRDIHYYNIVTKEIENVYIPQKQHRSEGAEMYYLTTYVLLKDCYVWIFPQEVSNGIFILDLKTKKIKKDKVLSEILSNYPSVVNYVEILGDRLFALVNGKNLLLEIDVEKEEVIEHKIPIYEKEIALSGWHNNGVWFVNINSGDIYEWEMGCADYIRYDAGALERIAPEGRLLGKCCFINDEVYVIPIKSKYVMKIDRKEKKLVKTAEYPLRFEFFEEREIFSAFSAIDIINDEIWLHPCRGNQLLIYNPQKKMYIGKELMINPFEVYNQTNSFNETDLCVLPLFLDYVIS